MLTTYETLTSALLQAPSSPIPLVPNSTLATYINIARNWVASQAECIRVYGSLTLVATQRAYPFSAITLSSVAGVNAVYNARQVWFTIPGTSGTVWVTPREFEWLSLYGLNNPVPPSGQPQIWSQFAQGENGSIYFDPIPDLPYAVNLDLSCTPIDLVDDTTVEAIPPLWTQAVPFYAAWYGFMSAQRQSDADLMMKRFHEQMDMARAAATPSVLPHQYEQAPNPTAANQLGLQVPGRAAAGG